LFADRPVIDVGRNSFSVQAAAIKPYCLRTDACTAVNRFQKKKKKLPLKNGKKPNKWLLSLQIPLPLVSSCLKEREKFQAQKKASR